MENVQTLETIALDLENMFDMELSTNQSSVNISGKTAEQIKFELDAMSDELERDITQVDHKKAELENLLHEPSDSLSSEAIQYATKLISNIQQAQQRKNTFDMLDKNYKQNLLSESGFENYDDVHDQTIDLISQKDTLKQKLFGGLRFKGKIEELNTKIGTLEDLSNQYNGIGISEPNYVDNIPLDSFQKELLNKFAIDIFSQYERLATRLVEKENKHETMPFEIFESLKEDYVSDYYTRIDEELEKNRKREDTIGRNSVAELENHDLVEQGADVLKQGLEQSSVLWAGKSYSKEHEKKALDLQSRLDKLPFGFRMIVEEIFGVKDKSALEEFSEFANYMNNNSLYNKKQELMTSFSHVKEKMYDMAGINGFLFGSPVDTIENLLDSIEEPDFDKIDMNRWNKFSNDENVKEFYGVKALDSFTDSIREYVFDNLLTTPEHTDKSVNLGNKAIWFKNAHSVAYNILNFWREPGYSGEMPFLLSGRSDSDRNLGAQYITSLSDGQLSAVKELNIPGLMEIIHSVKENPTTFNSPLYEEGGGLVDNPVYDNIQKSLEKICSHFLEHGSEKEKYFSMRAALMHDSMNTENKYIEQKNNLIGIIADNIGLDETGQSHFKEHPSLFLRHIRQNSKESTDPKEYEEGLVSISDYFTSLDEMLETARDPISVREKANRMQENQNLDVGRNLPNLLSYLKVFDTEFIQTQLEDKTYGSTFQERLGVIENNIFSNKYDGIKDISDYVVSDIGNLRHFIDTTNEHINKSEFSDILKSEQEKSLGIQLRNDNFIDNNQCFFEYLRALDDGETAQRFTWFDDRRKQGIKNVATKAYFVNTELLTPLVRKTVEKEKSPHKINLLQKGLSIIGQNEDLGDYVNELFQEQSNLGYDLLSKLSLAKPLLDGRFNENISKIFHNNTSIEEYDLGSKTIESLQQHNLLNDQDILDYCNSVQLQGKKIKDKKVLKLAKLKNQISRYENDLKENSENEELKKQLDERKDKVGLLVNNQTTSAIYSSLLESYSQKIEDIAGETVELKEINEDLTNAVLLYNDININEQLLSDLIKYSLTDNSPSLYSDEKNQEALRSYSSMGINTEKWVNGITRTYNPIRIENIIKEKEKQIKHHRDEAMELFAYYGLDVTGDTLFESYKTFRERDDIDVDVKRDLKTQLSTIKSLENQKYNSKMGDVNIYVERDPLKVLQMGNVVSGSCLGLGKGNSFATVANAVDSNKQVLYAEMNGEIIGRKLIALNDDGKIVQFRTYNNRLDIDVDTMFKQYIHDLAVETNTSLTNSGNVSNIIAERWYDDGIVPFE